MKLTADDLAIIERARQKSLQQDYTIHVNAEFIMVGDEVRMIGLRSSRFQVNTTLKSFYKGKEV